MDVTAADELIEHLVEFYDRTAGEYDAWAGGLNSRVAAKLVELAHPKRGQACLDVGCGTGLVSHLLAAKVGKQGSVVGIDLSARMLDLARRNVHPNTTFMAMAAENMVFREHSFDLITYGQSLHFLIDPFASLDEAVRLLRPGGRIAVSMQRRSLHTEAQELFYTELGKLAGRHHLRIPQHSTERAELGERHNLLSLLEEFGLQNVKMTELVTGGRVRSPREWTAIMTGTGPLPHTLISILGPRLRGEFEEQLEAAMSELGDGAFRYHFAFIFAVASLPP